MAIANFGGSSPFNISSDFSSLLPTSSSQDSIFNGSWFRRAYKPYQTWRLIFVSYSPDSGTPPMWAMPKLVLDSQTALSAGLIDMQCTIDRTSAQTNTMTVTLDDTQFKSTDAIQKNDAAMMWLGYKDYEQFTPQNSVFGGFVSDYDNLNVIDQKMKVTISAFDRALVFDKYKVSVNYDQQMELGKLMSKLLQEAKFPGKLDYTSTNVQAASYACADKRLSDCVREVINALGSYVGQKAGGSTSGGSTSGGGSQSSWTDCSQSGGGGSGSLATNNTETDKAGSSSLGTLCGKPDYYRWDFWLDYNLTPHFQPIKAKSNGAIYRFYYSHNLVGYERQKKGEFDTSPEAHDTYTMEVPIIPDINVYDNNIVQTGSPWNTMKINGMQYRVDQIDYTLPSTTMKITATKWPDISDSTNSLGGMGGLSDLLGGGGLSGMLGGGSSGSSSSDQCSSGSGGVGGGMDIGSILPIGVKNVRKNTKVSKNRLQGRYRAYYKAPR